MKKKKITSTIDKRELKPRLHSLLVAFKSDEVSLNAINSEVEKVRQKIYLSKKP